MAFRHWPWVFVILCWPRLRSFVALEVLRHRSTHLRVRWRMVPRVRPCWVHQHPGRWRQGLFGIVDCKNAVPRQQGKRDWQRTKRQRWLSILSLLLTDSLMSLFKLVSGWINSVWLLDFRVINQLGFWVDWKNQKGSKCYYCVVFLLIGFALPFLICTRCNYLTTLNFKNVLFAADCRRQILAHHRDRIHTVVCVTARLLRRHQKFTPTRMIAVGSRNKRTIKMGPNVLLKSKSKKYNYLAKQIIRKSLLILFYFPSFL